MLRDFYQEAFWTGEYNLKSMKSIAQYIIHPNNILKSLLWRSAKYIKNDKFYIQLKYLIYLGRFANLKHPKTFTEKLQWIKFNDRKPIYHKMVDKYEMKGYVSQLVGPEYVIPTLGIYDRFEDIDFSILPNEFVMKTTHDSHSVILCKNKETLDYALAKRKLNNSLKKDYYCYSREWPYKGLNRRVIIEPYLEDNSNSEFLVDYKFFCFNGEPSFFFIVAERDSHGTPSADYYYLDSTPCEFSQKNEKESSLAIQMPKNLSKMIEISRKVSQNTYQLRVDFYEIKGHPYVGELTFFDSGGYDPFVPKKYNKIIGDMIHLPTDKLN